MSTLSEIEQAIERLAPRERAELSSWLARREAEDWGEQMTADAESGKLDFIFREAAEERSAGRMRDWPEQK